MATKCTSNYTLTFSESSKGWPSFYSFYPDFMIGMNSFFYSFKGGNVWRHNTGANRNTYYDSLLIQLLQVFLALNQH